jgi:hypothetical protein
VIRYSDFSITFHGWMHTWSAWGFAVSHVTEESWEEMTDDIQRFYTEWADATLRARRGGNLGSLSLPVHRASRRHRGTHPFKCYVPRPLANLAAAEDRAMR